MVVNLPYKSSKNIPGGGITSAESAEEFPAGFIRRKRSFSSGDGIEARPHALQDPDSDHHFQPRIAHAHGLLGPLQLLAYCGIAWFSFFEDLRRLHDGLTPEFPHILREEFFAPPEN